MKIQTAILAILLGASASPLYAQVAQKTSPPETEPIQPPLNNWLSASSPGVTALATPASFLQYGPPPAGLCCPGCKNSSCIHRLIEWATYCPKERVWSSCCNSCQYKGVLPIYTIMMTPPCVCGSGLHATFTNQCYRGCNDCAAAAPCAAK